VIVVAVVVVVVALVVMVVMVVAVIMLTVVVNGPRGDTDEDGVSVVAAARCFRRVHRGGCHRISGQLGKCGPQD
jgi:hypothetical protein